jgi:hypothetical protein
MTHECLVPDRITVVGPVPFYAALRSEWADALPLEPCSRGACLLIIGHWAHETGWGHAMHCFNVGNFKHKEGDGRDYCAFPHWEIVGGVEKWFDRPPQNPPEDPFRAYDTLEDGVRDYLLSMRGRWRGAWPFVLDGNAPGFCHALKIGGYYTDRENLYAAGVTACMHAADQQIPPDAPVAIAPAPVTPVASYAVQSLELDADERKPDDPDETS